MHLLYSPKELRFSAQSSTRVLASVAFTLRALFRVLRDKVQYKWRIVKVTPDRSVCLSCPVEQPNYNHRQFPFNYTTFNYTSNPVIDQNSLRVNVRSTHSDSLRTVKLCGIISGAFINKQNTKVNDNRATRQSRRSTRQIPFDRRFLEFNPRNKLHCVCRGSSQRAPEETATAWNLLICTH